MTQRDAPLLVNPTPSWHKLSWMSEFVSQIPNYRSNTIDTVKLAITARELLIQHAEHYGFDFNREDRGILHVYEVSRTLPRTLALSLPLSLPLSLALRTQRSLRTPRR